MNKVCLSQDSVAGPTELRSFFVSQRRVLYKICLRSAHGNATEAEDIFGEATLKVVQTWTSQSGIDDHLAWWSTVVRNAARDRHRRRAVRGEVVELFDQQSPAACLDGSSQAAARQELHAVIASMARLTTRQQMALTLRAVGAGYQEIASALFTTAASARKLVQVARQRLRAEADGPRRGKRDESIGSEHSAAAGKNSRARVGVRTARVFAADTSVRTSAPWPSTKADDPVRKWPCNCGLAACDKHGHPLPPR